MFAKSLKILDGVIEYNDFDIDPAEPLVNQIESLKEDMLQIKFDQNFLIDVGWQPDFDPKGHFVVYIIHDFNWGKPILKKSCKTLSDLKKVIEEAALYINEQITK